MSQGLGEANVENVEKEKITQQVFVILSRTW